MSNIPGQTAPKGSMSADELRVKIAELVTKHTLLQAAFSSSMAGKQAYEKKAVQMADEAFFAAIQTLILDYYDGEIQFVESEHGVTAFKGSDE